MNTKHEILQDFSRAMELVTERVRTGEVSTEFLGPLYLGGVGMSILAVLVDIRDAILEASRIPSGGGPR